MTRTALVLGGGGVTGIAWETGLLAGLAAAGLDLTGAALLVGTSAGSAVAVQVACGVPVSELYAAQLAATTSEIPAKMRLGTLVRYARVALTVRDPQRLRARIGSLAMSAHTPDPQRRRAAIGARLPVTTWPERPLMITTVDAVTGEFTVLTAESGVDVVDAVAASCAVPGVWSPVTIGDRPFIDGGVRSPVNADLAKGYGRVVILAPMPRGIGVAESASTQAAALRAAGADVAVISPDRAAVRAIGRNVLDPARRASAAMAGYAQAASAAAVVGPVWVGSIARP